MKTDYNQISIEYQLSKLQPWRKHVEAYTFFTLLGDVSNRSVLDLACGDGFYTRQLKLRGATKVVGVDVSEKMVELAEKAEEKNPLGIDYIVQDVIGLRLGQTFDLISAAYLLNYAKTFEELVAFAKAISRHLKPGGRFVTINSNPDFRVPAEVLRKYGFTRHNESWSEGSQITYRFFQDDGSHFDIVNYHLEKSTHKLAFEKIGMTTVNWHPVQLSPELKKDTDIAFWKTMIDTQPIIGLSCGW